MHGKSSRVQTAACGRNISQIEFSDFDCKGEKETVFFGGQAALIIQIVGQRQIMGVFFVSDRISASQGTTRSKQVAGTTINQSNLDTDKQLMDVGWFWVGRRNIGQLLGSQLVKVKGKLITK